MRGGFAAPPDDGQRLSDAVRDALVIIRAAEDAITAEHHTAPAR
jgi:hypothetical protein